MTSDQAREPVDPQKYFRSEALKILARRTYSVHELEARLQSLGAGPEVRIKIITEFTQKRLLDDSEVASDAVRLALGSRKEGRRKIEMRLRARGVSNEIISDTLENELSSEDEFSTALKFGRRKFDSLKNENLQNRRRKVGSALGRRGFSGDIIYRVISTLSGESVELIHEED